MRTNDSSKLVFEIDEPIGDFLRRRFLKWYNHNVDTCAEMISNLITMSKRDSELLKYYGKESNRFDNGFVFHYALVGDASVWICFENNFIF